MDEIASTDLEHLTDIGRIVMEMLLTNITAKEPDSDPKEGRLRFHITYSLSAFFLICSASLNE